MAECQHDWASYMAWSDFGSEWMISYEKCLCCPAKRRRKLNVETLEPTR